MKALIVIELPDEHLLKATNGLYDRLKGYKCSLTSMPKKLQEDYILMGESVTWQKAIGWNECIDEILGGTNE